jgi:hypothetical protein
MVFQSLMGPRKSRCDVPNGTTQGHDYPSANENIYQYGKIIKLFELHKKMIQVVDLELVSYCKQ